MQENFENPGKIRYALDNLYGPGPDGYCGDEDNGKHQHGMSSQH